jgi:hypothetical protein
LQLESAPPLSTWVSHFLVSSHVIEAVPTGPDGLFVLDSLPRGRIRVVAGRPPAHISLVLVSNGAASSDPILARAPDFRFEASSLLPGPYELRAASTDVYLKGITRSGQITPLTTIDLAPGAVEKLELVAGADLARIEGTARQMDTQGPVAHAVIVLAGNGRPRLEQADQNGHFVFGKVVPGRYQIGAREELHTDSNPAPPMEALTVPSAGQVKIDLAVP